MSLFTPFLILTKAEQNTYSKLRCGKMKPQRCWFLYRGSLSWFLASHLASDLIVNMDSGSPRCQDVHELYQNNALIVLNTLRWNSTCDWTVWEKKRAEGSPALPWLCRAMEAPATLGCAGVRMCLCDQLALTLLQIPEAELVRLEKTSEEACLVLSQAARLKRRDRQGYPRANKLVLLRRFQISLS